MTSELLADYEEGTFTPAWTGSGGNPTVTYTTQTGQYTKIGNLVHVQAYSTALNVTSATSATIGGLPFTSNADYVSGTITHNTYAPNADNGHFSNSGTTFSFIAQNSTSAVNTSTGTKYVMMAGAYQAN